MKPNPPARLTPNPGFSGARRLAMFSIAGFTGSITQPVQAQNTDSARPAPGASNQPQSDQLSLRIAAVFELATYQYQSLLERLKSNYQQPRSFENGALKLVEPEDWTSGFFAGSLWMLYEYTADARWKSAARNYTHRVERIQYFRGHHDVGFMLNSSFGNGYRLTNERQYRKVLIQGARSLASRFKPNVGMIRSWDFKPWQYPVIVDNLMNLELLTWAARESGDDRLREIALTHADNTIKHHYRSDASSFHVVDFDSRTGAVLKKQTGQGAADDSAWARGQAWGLYGYTMMYRETRQPQYLAQAERIARFLMSHPRLPADKVPYWDFDAPGIPNTYRDSSAAAIMASALIELSGFTVAPFAEQCRQVARAQLLSLTSPAYLAGRGENGGFLLMHAVGSHPGNVEVDVPLNYADYYLLEALLRYRKWTTKP